MGVWGARRGIVGALGAEALGGTGAAGGVQQPPSLAWPSVSAPGPACWPSTGSCGRCGTAPSANPRGAWRRRGRCCSARAAAEEARRKETLHGQLVAELAALPRDVSRAGYTQRILELVGNIRKQKEEIGKILEDTRALQKEINALVGKLERTFSVTDELLFKVGRGPPRCPHPQNCAQLIRTIEDTGTIQREIRDLEEQPPKIAPKSSFVVSINPHAAVLG
ncbi:coiled-coil domain-containing protein 22 [Camarhynchus parvulus]|uniref:coiled-coil domain-containing protein 22 n=1 Tax=Geospiza parvula TaxID=87175 RepID=UPI0012383462|nr:coiled-coil domain-containing protein 22 [Camarhynchus parvulus]